MLRTSHLFRRGQKWAARLRVADFARVARRHRRGMNELVLVARHEAVISSATPAPVGRIGLHPVDALGVGPGVMIGPPRTRRLHHHRVDDRDPPLGSTAARSGAIQNHPGVEACGTPWSISGRKQRRKARSRASCALRQKRRNRLPVDHTLDPVKRMKGRMIGHGKTGEKGGQRSETLAQGKQ